jgi:Transposase and inactivated derivatives
MSNTYTQIHLQFVFAVRNRNALIHRSWKDELYQYITGIVQKNNHKLIVINGMPDHIHMLIGMRPAQSVSDLLQDIKASSTNWINEKRFSNYKFQWQDGYGAFSYSKSQIPAVVNYILNQEEHHRKKTFMEEYREILEKLGIDFNDRFIFKEPV